MKSYYFLILLSFSFFACEQEKEILNLTYEEGIAFTLDHNELATCECAGPTLKFLDVITDSRCPELFNCLWAGEVIIELEINEEVVQLGLSPINTAPDTTTVGSWTVTLLNVFPYPTDVVDDNNLDPSIYSVELRVEMP